MVIGFTAFTGYPIAQLSSQTVPVRKLRFCDFNGVFLSVFSMCPRCCFKGLTSCISNRGWRRLQSIPQPDIFFTILKWVFLSHQPMSNNRYLKSTKQHHIHVLVTCTICTICTILANFMCVISVILSCIPLKFGERCRLLQTPTSPTLPVPLAT